MNGKHFEAKLTSNSTEIPDSNLYWRAFENSLQSNNSFYKKVSFRKALARATNFVEQFHEKLKIWTVSQLGAPAPVPYWLSPRSTVTSLACWADLLSLLTSPYAAWVEPSRRSCRRLSPCSGESESDNLRLRLQCGQWVTDQFKSLSEISKSLFRP